MKYLLVCSIKGEAAAYHNKLCEDITSRFSIASVYQTWPIPHITLKSGFETNDISQIENLLKDFASRNKKSRILLSGFGNFDGNVIFINSILPAEAQNTFWMLIKSLKVLDWMTWNKYDSENRHFHSTIAAFDIKEKFTSIWEYLKQFNPNFEIYFDNVTILKEEKGRWVLHKEFRLA